MHARGTESWLMHIWRGVDKSRYQFDFLTIEGETGLYDDEIKKLGGRLLPVPSPAKKGKFLRAIRKAMKENGPYDIIHAHPFTLCGLIQLQAARAGIPVRLTHAHTDRRKEQRDKRWSRRIYGWASRRLIKTFSTAGLATSMAAATSLYGDHWWFDPRWQVMPCGIDLKPYEEAVEHNVRAEFGLTPQSKIIGHVGAFEIEKNHEFIVRAFADLARSDPKAVLMLVGDGPLRDTIEEQVRTLKLEKRVIFTGVRTDVPTLLRAMDLFIFPSLYEGLGMAMIEAQAAGLPCLVSDDLPQEADVVKGSVMRVSLEDDLDMWVDKMRLLLEAPKPHAGFALDTLRLSEYNVADNIERLSRLYEQLYVERVGL